MSIQELAPKQDIFELNLTEGVNKLIPELKDGVLLFADTDDEYLNRLPILRRDVASITSKILSFQLRRSGYIATQYENPRLENAGFLSESLGHSLVIVESPESDDKYVVDAAYSHFMIELGLPLIMDHANHTEKEAMIFKTNQVYKVASQIASIRNNRLRKVNDPTRLIDLKTSLPFIGVEDEKFAQHFSNIWKLDAYRPVSTRLEDDIKKYRDSPKSVPNPVRRLIQKLDASGSK